MKTAKSAFKIVALLSFSAAVSVASFAQSQNSSDNDRLRAPTELVDSQTSPFGVDTLSQRPAFLQMKDGQVAHVEYDRDGRISKMRFSGKTVVLVVNYDGTSKRALSIDAFDSRTMTLVKSYLILGRSEHTRAARAKLLENDDWTQDPFLMDTLDSIGYLLDPYGFSLAWDQLALQLRTPEERIQCQLDCYNTCSDNADIASVSCAVATAFAADVLTPVGAGLYGAVCLGAVIYQKNQCNQNCQSRCR